MDKWHSVFVGVDVTSVFAPFKYIEQFHTPIHEKRVFRRKMRLSGDNTIRGK